MNVCFIQRERFVKHISNDYKTGTKIVKVISSTYHVRRVIMIDMS